MENENKNFVLIDDEKLFSSRCYLSEYVDKGYAKWLYENIENYPFDKKKDDGKKVIEDTKNYCKEILKSVNGIVKKTYFNKDGLGRMFVKGLGLQNMKREIRTFLTFKNYLDLDIQNCQPSILLSICDNNEIDAKYLKKYVCARDEYFEAFKKCDPELTKEKFKEFFIMCMYGADFKDSKAEKISNYFNNKQNKENIYFCVKFYDNIEKITQEIFKHEYNKKYIEETKNKKNDNILSSALSLLLQNQENIIIQYVSKFLKKKNYNVDVLMFDGCMIRNNILLTDKILNELQKYINEKTKIRVNFIIKPLEPVFIPDEEDLDYTDEKEIIIENDEEASKIIIGLLKGDIIKSNNNYYYRKYPKTNIYEKDYTTNNSIINDKLIKLISQQNIKKETESGKNIKDYSKTTIGAKNISVMVKANLNDDYEFEKKIFNSNLGKLCFLNGYYDISIKSFKSYDNTIATISYINKNYDSNIDKKYTDILFKKIINPIFTNEDEKNLFFRWCSRSLFGCCDKSWAVGLGPRDTGKSVITKLFEVSFGSQYIRIFDSGCLMVKNNDDNDIAKSLSWLLDWQFGRLYFANEIKDNDKKKNKSKTLDGGLIKNISSGLDTKQARKNHKDEVNFQIQGNLCMYMNELVDIHPYDTTQNLTLFNFNNKFVDELTEEQKEINEYNKNNNIDFRYSLKDNQIFNLIKNDENLQLAFINYIISMFGNPIKKNNNLDEYFENDENNINKINEHFEFTRDTKDKIKIKSFNEYLTENNLIYKKSVIKPYLLSYGIKESNHPELGKCYVGIKLKKNN